MLISVICNLLQVLICNCNPYYYSQTFNIAVFSNNIVFIFVYYYRL